MLLYTNGCSFTYGDELQYPQQDAWPYVLAQLLKITVINNARDGASHFYIIRKTINDILQIMIKNKKVFVIIGWITINRMEKYNTSFGINFLSNRSMDTYNIFKYINNHEKLNFSYQLALHSFLEFYNIPHIFFDVYYQKYKIFQYHIIQYTMRDYIALKGCAFGPNAHPLEEGHKIWAQYLYDYIKDNHLL